MPDIQIQTIIFYNERDQKFIVQENSRTREGLHSGKLIAHLCHAAEIEVQSSYNKNILPFLSYCIALFKQEDEPDEGLDEVLVSPEEHNLRHKKAFIGFFSDLYREKLEVIMPGCFEKLCALMPDADLDNAAIDYLGWACELVLSNQLRKEDYPKLAAYLKAYNGDGEVDPIYGWTDLSLKTFPNLPSLYYEIASILPEETIIERKITGHRRKDLIECGDIHTVYDTGMLRIYMPLTEEASQVLGVGTEWCIAYTNSPCHFDDYNNKGRFLILFPVNERPIAIHFATYEFRDYANNLITLDSLITRFPVLSRIGSWCLTPEQKSVAEFFLSPNPTPRMILHANNTNAKVVAERLGFDIFNEKEFEDYMASIDPTKGIEKHYSNIRYLPDASPELQLLALQSAQEVLGRIKSLMPEEFRNSAAHAVKIFKILNNPIPDVMQWLEANRPCTSPETSMLQCAKP